MTEIPEHWRHYYEKLIDRGWIDPDTLKPIVNVSGEVKSIPTLPIDSVSLEQLRKLLLDLGIKDNNAIIARLYFELGRRSREVPFYVDDDDARHLFDLGTKNGKEAKKDFANVSDPLPVSENDYAQMALLLGQLAINDSDDKNKDETEKKYSEIIPRTFLYLQRRARECNGFKLNAEIDAIESDIIGILEPQIIKSGEKSK